MSLKSLHLPPLHRFKHTALFHYYLPPQIGSDIASLDVAPVPLGRTRAQFLAVGSHDSTVKIYSLDPDSLLQVCGMQHCEAAFPSSLLFMDSDATSAPGLDRQAVGGTTGGALFLQVRAPSALTERRMDNSVVYVPTHLYWSHSFHFIDVMKALRMRIATRLLPPPPPRWAYRPAC